MIEFTKSSDFTKSFKIIISVLALAYENSNLYNNSF